MKKVVHLTTGAFQKFKLEDYLQKLQHSVPVKTHVGIIKRTAQLEVCCKIIAQNLSPLNAY